MSTPERITLKAFRATDEPALCEEFIREHRRVLEDFGIANVTTNNDRWTRDPYCYVIVALHERLGMVGGIRLEIAKEDVPLPMELALMKFDARIHEALEDLRQYGKSVAFGTPIDMRTKVFLCYSAMRSQLSQFLLEQEEWFASLHTTRKNTRAGTGSS